MFALALLSEILGYYGRNNVVNEDKDQLNNEEEKDTNFMLLNIMPPVAPPHQGLRSRRAAWRREGRASCSYSRTWPRGYKTFFMLNSAEHEILIAHKYENIKKFSIFQAEISLECYFFLLINVKMSTTVGILTFMSRKNFMLS